MYSRDKLPSEYSVLNSTSRTFTWCVCVCVCLSSKKPYIDALAFCKILPEGEDRLETDMRPVGCGMDPPDGDAVLRGPSRLL